MHFSAFTTVLALIISLFMLTSALPTPHNTAPASPRSLLGRRYVRQLAANTAPRAAREASDITQSGPARRADRFQAAQRRIARNPAAERIVHDENLLSNQSWVAPPVETPVQAPTALGEPTQQAHLDASEPSATLVPQPTPTAHARKHSKSAEKKAGGKAGKKA